jgi:hypothetical protein
MKKLIASALFVTAALAAAPLFAHPGQGAAGCAAGAAGTPQGSGPGQGMGGMHRMGGTQAMNGAQGMGNMQRMGERMGGNHERMAARTQACPQAQQGAADEEHKH